MDDRQLAKSASEKQHRPRLAGTEYTLAPVSVNGAFHPKIILLVGSKSGALFLGSHNVTLAGFSFNRELTNRVMVKKPFDAVGVNCLAEAWNFIEAWIRSSDLSLPNEVQEAIFAVRRFAPWLEGKDPQQSDITVFGSTPDGKSLWQKILNFIDFDVRRVTVLGAFFDRRFDFVRRLQKDLRPREIIIAVEPTTVKMPARDKVPESVQVLDGSALYRGSGYLHAKALIIESMDGEVMLITGSANPSYPAWLAGPQNRNSEIMAVRTGSAAIGLIDELGFSDIEQFPTLSADDWDKIGTETDIETPSMRSSSTTTAIAVEAEAGLELQWPYPDELVDIRLFDIFGDVSARIPHVQPSDGKILLTVSPEAKRSAARLEAALNDGRRLIAFVHHTGVIRRKTSTSKQADLRSALAGLNSNYPDLGRLITLIEKVIFDEENPPEIKVSKGPAGPGGIPLDEAESLAISLTQSKKTKKRNRVIDTGDLGYLLDLLIYQLGVGLERTSDQVDHLGRTEEELIGSDDEDEPEEFFSDIDPSELVEVCRRKVTTLVSRMIKQLKRSAQGESSALLGTTQLVAVLSTLRELRVVQATAKWVPPRASLIPRKQSRRLFDEALGVLFGRDFMLMEKALIEAGPEPADEVSRLRGLLLWLAWDAGAELHETRSFGESPAELKQRILEKARFLVTAPDAATDGVALDEAFESILRCALGRRQAEAETWLEHHIDWGRTIGKLLAQVDLNGPPPKTRLNPGAIVIPPASKTGMPRIVSAANPTTVNLIDLGKKETIGFATSKVVAL